MLRAYAIARPWEYRFAVGAAAAFTAFGAAAAFLAVGCRSASGPVASIGPTTNSITVTSRSFASGGSVPVDFTCDGADRSPELKLSALPAEARSLSVVVDDPDAPGGTFTHWIAYNLAPDTAELSESADASAYGGASASNDFQRLGYSGPCPPKGDAPHRYRFRALALDSKVALDPSAARARFDAAIKGHVVAEGVLVGSYGR
jgi:Raf kinase inhibitor-like YbhB/YbcL family protein